VSRFGDEGVIVVDCVDQYADLFADFFDGEVKCGFLVVDEVHLLLWKQGC